MIYYLFHSKLRFRLIIIDDDTLIIKMDLEKKRSFTQESENAPAKFVLIHKPSKEIFLSMLHPAASLYENVTEDKSVTQCFRSLIGILSQKGIEVKTVRDCLKLNRETLEELAMKSLVYELDSSSKNQKVNEKLMYYLSDNYKRQVISKLLLGQLVDVVLTQPKYKLAFNDSNTFIEPVCISFNPLGNILFCRDQQIITQKGVIIGRAWSKQREIENAILKQVFDNLNTNIIGHIPEGCYLEGGDFFVAKKDLTMLGIGLRTNSKAADYLMKNDLLGTKRFALIYDKEDIDQQRMHLDTYFNILSEKYVIALDFDETAQITKKNVYRKVYLYSNAEEQKIASDENEIPSSSGQYKLVKIFKDFYEYLKYENFTCIKVTYQQQLDYMINFLNIGNNTVLTVNPDLKHVAKDTGVEIIHIEFRPVMNMFGALHCATQVARKSI